MRFSTPVEYQTLGQALVKGTCPFCTFLKNFQSKLLHELNDPAQITAICNFHTWAMAAAGNKAVVSCVFKKLVKETSIAGPRECSLCKIIAAEEDTRMKEFAGEVSHTRVLDWVNAHGSFCIPHGNRFLDYLPHSVQAIIRDVLKRNAIQLYEALEQLTSEKLGDKGPGGGVLGHAAEFLVSQRGL